MNRREKNGDMKKTSSANGTPLSEQLLERIGQRAAVQAAKLGKRAAIIERGHVIGGVCVDTGTIPSKTFREAVLSLNGRVFPSSRQTRPRSVIRPRKHCWPELRKLDSAKGTLLQTSCDATT